MKGWRLAVIETYKGGVVSGESIVFKATIMWTLINSHISISYYIRSGQMIHITRYLQATTGALLLMADSAKFRNMSTEDADPAWWGFTSATYPIIPERKTNALEHNKDIYID